jgi:hypothetical protein
MHLRPCRSDARPGRPAPLTLAVAVTALLATACTTGGTGGAARAAPAPLPCDPHAVPRPGPRIAVASPGRAPRSPLRYHPVAGHAVRSTAVEETSTDQSVDSRRRTFRQTARVTYTARVGAVCGRLFTVTLVYGTPAVDHPDPQETVPGSRFALLGGLVVRESRDLRGLLVTASRAAPAAADADTQEALDELLGQLGQSAVVFPDRPLGLGARWTSEQVQTVSGVRMTSRAEYTLAGRSDRQVTLRWRLTAGAAPQVARIQGRSVSVDSYAATGTGTLEVDLAAGTATAGRLELSVRQVVQAGGTPVDQRARVLLTVARA